MYNVYPILFIGHRINYIIGPIIYYNPTLNNQYEDNIVKHLNVQFEIELMIQCPLELRLGISI